MALTDTAARKAQATDKVQKLTDGSGLHLRLEPTGRSFGHLGQELALARSLGRQVQAQIGLFHGSNRRFSITPRQADLHGGFADHPQRGDRNVFATFYKMSVRGMLSCLIAAAILTPITGNAQADSRIASSMTSLKSMAGKVGAPKLEGREAVGGKDAPALYFGSTKVNNNFDIVDAASNEDGKGMTATFFAKSGHEYIRVSTSVPKPDGSGRAIGTVLAPAGKAIAELKQGKSFYGEVGILGTPYITGYEPMRDAAGNIIGIYYVGYKK